MDTYNIKKTENIQREREKDRQKGFELVNHIEIKLQNNIEKFKTGGKEQGIGKTPNGVR